MEGVHGRFWASSSRFTLEGENVMKRMIAVCCLLGLVVGVPVLGQEQPADEAAMRESWLKAATPGPFHAFLAKKVGKWHIAGKSWLAPDAEPELSESTGEAEMILGGRYLLEKMHGEVMGMPYDGMGITGYDNVSGVVTALWMDSMGTTIMVMTGKWEKPGAPLVTTGTYTDPMTGQQMAVRTVTTFVSGDESLFEYFAATAGMPESKMMELRYHRIK